MAVLLWLALLQDARELVRRLASEDAALRDDAHRRLIEMGAAAVEDLRRAASSPDIDVATRASIALRVIELRTTITPRLQRAIPDAVDRLARGTDATWTTVFMEAAAVKKTGTPHLRRVDLRPLAVRAVRGARGSNRIRDVCRIVFAERLDNAFPETVGLLTTGDGNIRTVIVEGLRGCWNLESRPAADRLIESAGDEDPIARGAAVEALQWVAHPGRIRALQNRLSDAEPDVRRLAAETLAGLDHVESIAALRPLLDDTDDRVRSTAALALAALGDEESVPNLARRLERADSSDAQDLMRALALLRARDAVPLMLERLRDEDAETRIAAIEALADLGFEPATSTIRSLLGDPEARERAVWALGRLEAREAAPDLIALLDDEELAETAAVALSVMDHEELVPRMMDRYFRAADRSSLWLEGIEDLNASAAAETFERFMRHPDAEIRIRALELAADFNVRTAAPQIVASIRDPDPAVRERAIAVASTLEIAEAIPALVEAVEDESPDVRCEAIEALGELGGPWNVLLPLLASDDPSVRRWAAYAIESFAEARPAATPLLLRTLSGDGEMMDRMAAAHVLARWKVREALPGIARLAEEGEPRTIEWLQSFDAEGAEAIVRYLHRPDPPQKGFAVIALARLGAPQAAEEARRLLDDPDSRGRHDALSALVRADPAAAADLIEPRIQAGLDDYPDLRLLSEADPARAIPYLIERIGGEDADERSIAQYCFKRGDAFAPAAPLLMPLLRHPSEGVRWQAFVAIENIHNLAVVPALVELAEDTSAFGRSRALYLPAEFGDPRAIEPAKRLLKDRDPDVRNAAIRVLARLAPREAGALIEPLLSDRDPPIWTLGEIGYGEAVPRIAARLSDPDPRIRSEAILALSELGARDHAAAIAAHLNRPREDERCAALEALGRLRAVETIDAVVPLLLDGSNEVRARAGEALCRMGSPLGIRTIMLEARGLSLGDLEAHSSARYLRFVLNAVRRPKTWNRLAGRPVERMEGTTRSVLERLATAAGLKLEITASGAEEWLEEATTVEADVTFDGLLDALTWIADDYDFTLILEDESIRLVRTAEAMEIWKSLWRETRSR